MNKLVLVATLTLSLTLHAEEPKPAVAYVNVAGAVDPALFAKSVTNFLPGVMSVRTKIVNVDKVDVASIANPRNKDGRLGKESRLAVYFVKDPAFPPQLTAPGMWAIINVRNLEKDADKAKFEKRLQKMVLKGLAFSCGFGANQDVGRCVMGAGSFDTLSGIDSTSASYSPFVAFPMMDYLSARGLIAETPYVE